MPGSKEKALSTASRHACDTPRAHMSQRRSSRPRRHRVAKHVSAQAVVMLDPAFNRRSTSPPSAGASAASAEVRPGARSPQASSLLLTILLHKSLLEQPLNELHLQTRGPWLAGRWAARPRRPGRGASPTSSCRGLRAQQAHAHAGCAEPCQRALSRRRTYLHIAIKPGKSGAQKHMRAQPRIGRRTAGRLGCKLPE